MIKDLLEKESELLNSASEKEVIFYNYLLNTPLPHPNDKNISEILSLCYGAFTTPYQLDSGKAKSYAHNSKPIKGMHYSNNLIELAALARHNMPEIRSQMNTYIETHGTKERYILKQVFPEVEITPNNSTTIDRLVDEIILKKNRNYPIINLLSMIREAKDLLDLYTIKSIWVELIDSKIVYLLRWHVKIISTTKWTINSLVNSLIIGLLITYLWLIWKINQTPNNPLDLVIIFVELGIMPAFYFVYQAITGNKIHILNHISMLKDKLSHMSLTRIYRILSYDYRIINKLIADYS